MKKTVIVNGIEFHVEKNGGDFTLNREICIWYKIDNIIYAANIPEKIMPEIWKLNAVSIVKLCIKMTLAAKGKVEGFNGGLKGE